MPDPLSSIVIRLLPLLGSVIETRVAPASHELATNSENAIDMSETILAYVRSIKSFSNFEPCIISAIIKHLQLNLL